MIELAAGLGLMVRIEEHLDDAGLETLIAEDHVHDLLALLLGQQTEAAVFLRVLRVVDGLGHLDVVDAESIPLADMLGEIHLRPHGGEVLRLAERCACASTDANDNPTDYALHTPLLFVTATHQLETQ